MKIQIDTENKIIRIEEKVSLSNLFDELEKRLSEEEWKEYSIEAINTITYPVYPIYSAPPYEPQLPWTNPWQNPIIY